MYKLIFIILFLLGKFCFAQVEGVDNLKQTHRDQPFLGVSYQVVDSKNYHKYISADFGYQIMLVIPHTAADLIGLLENDIIVGIDEENLHAIEPKNRQKFLSEYIKSKNIGEQIKLEILRIKTKISSNKNDEILNIESLKNLLDSRNQLGKHSYEINKTLQVLTLNAKLGKRENIANKDLPTNAELLPKYANYTSTYTTIFKQQIKQYNLKDDYQDLLRRYTDNERWDNGFRLKLMRFLHRDPPKITLLDDKLIQLESAVANGVNGKFNQTLADWIDIDLTDKNKNPAANFSNNIAEQLNFIKTTLNQAHNLKQQAFINLNSTQTIYIKQQLPKLLNRFEHSLYISRTQYPSDKKHNADIIDLAKKINFKALGLAMNKLLLLSDDKWLAHIKQLLNQQPPQNWQAKSLAGNILLSNKNNQQYTDSHALILDSFGNDIYRAKSTLAFDNIAVILDLDGNDTYQHTQKFTQGGAFLALSLLLDTQGDDIYIAKNHAQAFAAMGIAYLIDQNGNDNYHAQAFAQGNAFWGLAALIDFAGNDNYHANLYAQGVGGVKGAGLLLDKSGSDNYFASGDQPSSYGNSGVFKGLSQGVGVGFRGHASGGVGVLLDLAGEDVFRAGNFSQGVGYFYGIGLLKNAGIANDNYTGSRYAQGASAHSAIGMLIDDGGDDNYHNLITAGQSAAWDLALASLWDKHGNDTYHGDNAFASHNSFSLFIDSEGADTYHKISGGNTNTYHGGKSFGIFIDQSGTDTYPATYKNQTQRKQNEHGLFVDF